MKQTLIVFPVLLQVALTFLVLLSMGPARAKSARVQRKSIQDYALAGPSDWTEDAQKRANNFRNQFELPVLFYVCAGMALATTSVDLLLLGLAWLFVLTRVVHAYIHTGTNIVSQRAIAYLIGAGALMAMWIVLAVRLTLAHL